MFQYAKFVHKVESVLAKDPSLELKDIAQILKITPKYLSRVFSKKGPMSFLKFRNKIVIDRAKVLLADKKLRLKDIAAKLGYTNHTSFLRFFKESTGLTAGEYRSSVLGFEKTPAHLPLTNYDAFALGKMESLIDIAKANFITRNFKPTDQIMKKYLDPDSYRVYRNITSRLK